MIREKLQNWYGMLSSEHDMDEMVQSYQELNRVMYDNHSADSLVMFEIHKIRYFLVIGKSDEALSQINKLAEMSGTFDTLHQFYWYKFKGNYNSGNNEFNQAMRKYEAAEEKLNQLELSEEEVADLQYTIAVTHSKLRNTLEAIDYAEKAITTFRVTYNFSRCAQCHIVLGISYRRIRLHDKAIKNYNLAKHLGELKQNTQIIQLTNQNLGYLYSTIAENRKAISNYEEIVKEQELMLLERITASTSLIKVYYNISNYDKAKEMVEISLDLLKEVHDKERFQLFYYITHTYNYAIHQEAKKFEMFVIDEFIPYLKKHKDYANLVIYANMLAQHFEANNRYKESVKYYKLANDTYEELISL